MMLANLHLLLRQLTICPFMAWTGRPLLPKVSSYVMTDSKQVMDKLSVTCMDFEGISFEMPITLYVMDLYAHKGIAHDLLM
jgi:hypothetical protein